MHQYKTHQGGELKEKKKLVHPLPSTIRNAKDNGYHNAALRINPP